MAAAPLTSDSILVPSLLAKLEELKQGYDSPTYRALKAGVSPDKTRFINHVAKFCYIAAENCLKDVELVAGFATIQQGQ